MTRILFLTNIPSPYRVDFFNCLGAMPETELTVAFLFRPKDRNDRNERWYREDYSGFQTRFLDRRMKLPGGQWFHPEIKALLQEPFDHIVICGYSHLTLMYAIRSLKRRGVPFYLEIDGGLISSGSGVRERLKRQCISAASCWFSTGAASDRFLLHYGAKAEGLIRYPFTSVREAELAELTDLTAEAKAEVRKKLGIPEKRVLVAVGSFYPLKGFELLLKAAKELPRDLGIYIIGGRPTEAYEAIVREDGLTNVRFLDFMVKEELWDYYHAADLFVLPTLRDVWGLVVNEAMACGLPVVTTDNCVAGLEMVENGKNGLIVKTGESQALLHGLLQALDSDLAAMGEAALHTARDYTIEKMAAAHHAAFCRDEVGEKNA